MKAHIWVLFSCFGLAGVLSVQAEARPPIPVLPSTLTAIVGSFASGPIGVPTHVTSDFQLRQIFSGPQIDAPEAYEQADQFFLNTQTDAWVIRVVAPLKGPASIANLLAALPKLPRANIILVPEIALYSPSVAADADHAVIQYAQAHHAIALLDMPISIQKTGDAISFVNKYSELRSASAAIYYPRLTVSNVAGTGTQSVGVAGSAAGIFARMEQQAGVWKAPAGGAANVFDAIGVVQPLSTAERDLLVDASINPVVISQSQLQLDGARNLSKPVANGKIYISTTRFELMIEESLTAGFTWTVFEPDTEATWAAIRLSANEFFQGLFTQGALQGQLPQQAYFVKCDSETTTPADVSAGRIKLVYGYALAQPSEFTVGQLGLGAE